MKYNSEALVKEVQGYLAEDPLISDSLLAAKTDVHYTVVKRIREQLRKQGKLPKVITSEPAVDLPLPQMHMTYKFNPKSDCLRLVPITDIHIGEEEGMVDWDSLLGNVDYIVNHPDTVTILLGDYVNGTIHGLGSPSAHPSPWKASLTPTEQYSLFYDKVLLPLAESGKLLGVLPGDHDSWLARDRGFDADQILTKFLPVFKDHKVPYLTDGCWLNIGVGEYMYSVYARHGEGSAKTDSGRRSCVQRQFERIDADIKLTGHHHLLDTWKTCTMEEGKIRKSYVVMCGTFLRYQGGYAESWGLYPNSTGVAKIKLFRDRWDVHVSI